MLDINFDPFPVLVTERLVLRKLSMADVNAMFDLRTKDEVMRYIGRPRPKGNGDIEEMINKMNETTIRIQWGICLKENDEIIGTIGYHRIEKEHYRAEVGYLLHPDHWQTGIMSEALNKIIDFGFNEMNLHSVEAIINPENVASRSLLMKSGFIKEGYFKENFFFEGKFYDSEVYSLLKN